MTQASSLSPAHSSTKRSRFPHVGDTDDGCAVRYVSSCDDDHAQDARPDGRGDVILDGGDNDDDDDDGDGEEQGDDDNGDVDNADDGQASDNDATITVTVLVIMGSASNPSALQ